MELTISADEIKEKDRRIAAFLQERNLGGLLISGKNNFAWATCGRNNRVGKGGEFGVGHVLHTADGKKYLLCDNIEEPRLKEEEKLEEQGFEFVTGPWYTYDLATEAMRRTPGSILATDMSIPGAQSLSASDWKSLRLPLLPTEMERYRWLGKTASEALEMTAQAIEPGMSEHEVGAIQDHFLEDEGIVPWLTLIASDERIERYRHPIPTSKTINRYVMLVGGANAFGLTASITRIVYFGSLPAELARKHDAVCYVDTVFNASTTAGANVADIFALAQEAYSATGFGDEWLLHHQGGATGYVAREYRGRPGLNEAVQANQAFAWNPSITGTKSEDTILSAGPGNAPEILTAHSSNWPSKRIETPYGTLDRPRILIR
jgi:Xaa-Pro aminopeptidase